MNNWSEALRHATDEGFNAETMMCFAHDGEAVLTFHADNVECIGIVCSKFFKFFLSRLVWSAHQRLHGLAHSQHKEGKKMEG